MAVLAWRCQVPAYLVEVTTSVVVMGINIQPSHLKMADPSWLNLRQLMKTVRMSAMKRTRKASMGCCTSPSPPPTHALMLPKSIGYVMML